jgi:hypothetical protein
MTPSIIRLYREFIEATDRAARQFADDRSKILQLEREICAELERNQGHVTVGNLHFALSIVSIDKQRICYFKVVVLEERRASAGYSFERRRTDISPPAPIVGDRPSIRRKREASI